MMHAYRPEDLTDLQTKELQAIAAQRGLALTGNKDAIKARILENNGLNCGKKKTGPKGPRNTSSTPFRLMTESEFSDKQRQAAMNQGGWRIDDAEIKRRWRRYCQDNAILQTSVAPTSSPVAMAASRPATPKSPKAVTFGDQSPSSKKKTTTDKKAHKTDASCGGKKEKSKDKKTTKNDDVSSDDESGSDSDDEMEILRDKKGRESIKVPDVPRNMKRKAVEAYDSYKQARVAENLLNLCKDDKDNKKFITAILKSTGNKTRDKSAAELSRDLAYFVYNTDESSDSESSESDSSD